MTDMVNHPPHYKTESGMEAIDVIDAFFRDDYYLGQVFRYTARSGKKFDELEDLQKAQWYLNRAVNQKKAEVYGLTEDGQIKPGDVRSDWRDFPEGTRFTDSEGDVFVRVKPYTGKTSRNDGVRWFYRNDEAWAIHWNTESFAPYTVVESG